MADYPVVGTPNWGPPLKAYIDEFVGEVSGLTGEDEAVAFLVADEDSDTSAALATAVGEQIDTPGTPARVAADALYVPRLEAILEAPLSPYRYGLTDAMKNSPADAANVRAALQATMNALPPRNGAMRIPRGPWYYDQTAITTSGRQFAILGEERHTTSLLPVDGAVCAIHVLADTAPNYGSGVVRNLTIGPVVVTPNPGLGIKVEGAHAADVLIEDLWIGSMSTGIEFYLAPNCAVSRTIIEACQGAGIFASTSHLLTLTDIQTFQNNAHGIYLNACEATLILGGKMIENYNHGIFVTYGGDISILGTLFDNNSKDFSSGTPINWNLFDNIRFLGVNVGQIVATVHANSLGFAFTRKGIDIDASSYRIDVLGGSFNAGAFNTDILTNASGEGQTITRHQTAFRPKIKLGSIFLRDNAGVLEKSTDDINWTAV